MIEREIIIDGMQVHFKASATVPRLYRAKFGRDIFRDIKELSKSVDDKNTGKTEIGLEVLEVFENVAYIMAKHADPAQADTPEEWLDKFNTFSIYEVLPQLLDLWQLNIRTHIESKKKLSLVVEK